MPPQEIWHHDAELHAHFDRVKAAREAKYQTAPGGEPYEDVPGAETVDFDLTDELRDLRR